MHKVFALALSALTAGVAVADTPAALAFYDLPAAAPFADGSAVESRPFGENFGGRALWLSANGRFVAMFRLTDDTDKNGELNIQFGMHGESGGDELMLDVFDIEAGEHQRFDDLLTRDPSGRFIVLRRGPDTLLFDSTDGSAKKLRDLGGGASADANACMSPRQITFDPDGQDVALLRDDPAQIVVYSPATGASRVAYRSERPLWRAWFTSDPGWFLAIEVKGKFPTQHTSCVSNSRRVFAASYSFNGFDGVETTRVLIDAQGKRHALQDEAALVTGGTHMRSRARTLHRVDGNPVALPKGCTLEGGAAGARVVVLKCGSNTALFDPATGEKSGLPARESLELIEGSRTRTANGTWYGVRMAISGATDSSNARLHAGRLRMEDLRLERGPAVFGSGFTGHPDWMAGGNGDDYYLLNLATGAMLTARAKNTEAVGDAFALRVDSQTALLMDPTTGRMARTTRAISAGNGHGCFIAASGEMEAEMFGNLDEGPWIRVCVAGGP